jgi:hypothetical protein
MAAANIENFSVCRFVICLILLGSTSAHPSFGNCRAYAAALAKTIDFMDRNGSAAPKGALPAGKG